MEKAKLKSGNNSLKANDLRQDEDVLDTWFSSWLWPISVFDGIRYPENEEIQYYYPTQDLVTGPDILFFWVARMIMSGYAFRDEKPFSKVYLTGLVRDQKGRKMSKQLGNSPDAIKLIEDFGADAVRVGLMLSSAAGNDLLFDESLCQQGKNFANKIWNAYRLIEGWKIKEDLKMPKVATEALEWYENQFEKSLAWVDENFDKYRISDALMSIYKLVWDDFCSWLLELIKPEYGQPIDRETYKKVITLFEKNLRILHPFMPFITEELWHFIADQKQRDSLTVSAWPVRRNFNEKCINDFELVQQIIGGIRNFRKEKNIVPKDMISLYINKDKSNFKFESAILKLGGVSEIKYSTPPEDFVGGSFRIRNLELFIPTNAAEDPEAEKEKLTQELSYTKGFLASVEKKLSNKRFVANAPEKVIDLERKKASDAREKILLLEKNLGSL